MYEGWYDVNTVFSAVQGPHRARPGYFQEPRTGRDRRGWSILVPETSGRRPLLRTAGPTMYDRLAWGTAGDCEELRGTAR